MTDKRRFDWRSYFLKFNPRLHREYRGVHFQGFDNVEDLYQAFKARYEYEQAQKKAQDESFMRRLDEEVMGPHGQG